MEPAAPGQPWTYRVTFRRTGSWLVTALKELLGGTRPEVRVWLPNDTPLNLDLDVSQGGAEIELGGLWLTSADLNLDKGGCKLDISEPLHAPMERLQVRGSMGGLAATGLGNASPRRLEVDFSMGGMSLDLGGRWVRDSDVTIRTRMSGAAVQLPRDVNVVGLDRERFDLRERPEVPRPTLRFSVTTDERGELRFVD
jgi:hypothetical protein